MSNSSALAQFLESHNNSFRGQIDIK